MEEKAFQFHRITPRFQFCGTWNTPKQFECILRYFKEHDVPVILPGQGENGIIITFDDGERSVYEYAFPILKQYNMKALVFLIVDYIGKKNTWDVSLPGSGAEHLTWTEIHEMKKWGIEFGSHTMSHRNLTHLTPEDVKYELSGSKRILDKEVGACRCLSYPFNRMNELVIQMAREVGYEYGFGGDGSHVLGIKKEAMYITDTRFSLGIKVFEKPGMLYWYERTKQRVINLFTLCTMITQGIKHH